ncbi:DUF3817 domain-containing protein [Antricoccus suffuscus]|nr:DUF3817 domain-containing protein [Antricoccus suffuscus]
MTAEPPKPAKPFVTFDLRRAVPTSTWVKWWRFMAFAEAVSWALLLTGMYFKYLAADPTPVLVTIFGSVHGAIFVAFGILTLQLWQRLKWTYPVVMMGCLSTIPPFCSVVFELWAQRTGRLEHKLGQVGDAAQHVGGPGVDETRTVVGAGEYAGDQRSATS